LIVVWAIVILLFIGFMILTHEAGHFFAAKKCGIKVDQFSIGFGPEIVGWTRGETRYSLKWILAGGSVRIAGMNPEEEISEEDLPRTYYQAPLWKRFIVVVAGSFVHIVIALILFIILFWPVGHQEPTGTNKVGGVLTTVTLSNKKTVPGPAFAVHILPGDIINSVDGNRTADWSQLIKQVQKRPGRQVLVTYLRGKTLKSVKVKLLDVDGKGFMGIEQSQKLVRTNPIAAIGQGFKMLGQVTVAIFKGIVSLFSVSTLKILLGLQARGAESPRSIVGATQLAFQAAAQGVDYFIFIIAEFFLFLAVINLAPLPPLDGGHVLVIFIEWVFKKRIDVRKLAPIAWVVIIILTLVAARLALLDLLNPLKNPFGP
jgi:regulator of sigma E protease